MKPNLSCNTSLFVAKNCIESIISLLLESVQQNYQTHNRVRYMQRNPCNYTSLFVAQFCFVSVILLLLQSAQQPFQTPGEVKSITQTIQFFPTNNISFSVAQLYQLYYCYSVITQRQTKRRCFLLLSSASLDSPLVDIILPLAALNLPLLLCQVYESFQSPPLPSSPIPPAVLPMKFFVEKN